MMNELTGFDCKMEAENRNQFEKSLLEEINDIKKTLGTELMVCSLGYLMCYFKNGQALLPT